MCRLEDLTCPNKNLPAPTKKQVPPVTLTLTLVRLGLGLPGHFIFVGADDMGQVKSLEHMIENADQIFEGVND